MVDIGEFKAQSDGVVVLLDDFREKAVKPQRDARRRLDIDAKTVSDAVKTGNVRSAAHGLGYCYTHALLRQKKEQRGGEPLIPGYPVEPVRYPPRTEPRWEDVDTSPSECNLD